MIGSEPPELLPIAMSQRPSKSPSAPLKDVTLKSAMETVQNEHMSNGQSHVHHQDHPVSMGACILINLLHSSCFFQQNKSQVCCLQEQVENDELKTLWQRISLSNSQVHKLQEKLESLK